MFCSNCGNEIADESRFCPKCGAKLGESSDESATNNENYEETEVSTNEIVDESEGGEAKSGLIKNNKGGLIVAVATIFICLYACFTGDADEGGFSLISVIVGSPFAFFTGCAGWAVAKSLKQHLAPDVVFYTKTSSLIAKKLWWGGGIHIFCSFIGSILPIGIIQLIVNALFGVE